MNYSWMPELTLRMAHYMVAKLPIKASDTVLDFGCAKGFVVRALRILDIEAFGVDISDYAIDQAPADVRDYCRHIGSVGDIEDFGRTFDWLISKDVFEHVAEEELRDLLQVTRELVRKMFVVVPLGRDDGTERFVIPNYDQDKTHVTVKPLHWWRDLFEQHGWKVLRESFNFAGVKENWVAAAPKGNGFFVLERRRGRDRI